ncbi:MAG: DMT family transporter [Actinomycetota bacterium]|nr:DMT family transporter [Actinomycetota bacterium]
MARLTSRIEGRRDNRAPAPETAGPRHGDLGGIALAAFAAIAFGTLAISAKFGYRAGAGFIPLLATRFAIATILLGAFHLVTGRTLAVGRAKVTKLVLLGALGYAFEAALFFAALERAPAGVVGLVFYSYPLWTTLMGFVSGIEPFRWQTVGALGLGSVGVALVFSLPNTDLAGPLLALGAAVAVAIYFILMQVVLGGRDASAAAFWTTLGAALALSVAGVVAGQPMPADALIAATGLGVASSIAFVALYMAITRIGSSRAAVAAMLEPVTTLLLAAVFLSEAITDRVVVGAVLVVGALPLLAFRSFRRSPQPTA